MKDEIRKVTVIAVPKHKAVEKPTDPFYGLGRPTVIAIKSAMLISSALLVLKVFKVMVQDCKDIGI